MAVWTGRLNLALYSCRVGCRRPSDELSDLCRSALRVEWTIAEAMAYLRVSRATLYRLSADGRLPYFTVGSSRDRRFRRRDLDAALLPAEKTAA